VNPHLIAMLSRLSREDIGRLFVSRIRVIYDPVTDACRTNSAAMRFATAKGACQAEYGCVPSRSITSR